MRSDVSVLFLRRTVRLPEYVQEIEPSELVHTDHGFHLEGSLPTVVLVPM